MPNPFRAALASGRAADERSLKRLFWRLAIKLHPDTAPSGDAEVRFVRLKADFDAVMAELAARPPDAPPSGRGSGEGPVRAAQGDGLDGLAPAELRKRCLRAFIDLVALNFPVAADLRRAPGYLKRLSAFARLLARVRPDLAAAFPRIEAELYALRGDDIVNNPFFGAVKMIFYTVVSWHHNPSRFSLEAVRRLRIRHRPELSAAGYPNLAAFIDWLVDDLESGPVWGEENSAPG